MILAVLPALNVMHQLPLLTLFLLSPLYPRSKENCHGIENYEKRNDKAMQLN